MSNTIRNLKVAMSDKNIRRQMYTCTYHYNSRVISLIHNSAVFVSSVHLNFRVISLFHNVQFSVHNFSSHRIVIPSYCLRIYNWQKCVKYWQECVTHKIFYLWVTGYSLQRKIREADSVIQETGRELMLRAQDLMVARKEQNNIVSTIDTLNLCIPGRTSTASPMNWTPSSLDAWNVSINQVLWTPSN